MTPKSFVRPYAALGLTILLWAGSFPATRVALHDFTPDALMCARFVLAASLLAAWGRWRGVAPPRRADVWRFLVIGSVSGFLYQMAFNYAMRTVHSGPAAALINSAPIFTAILGALFLGERVGLAGALGVLAGFAGALLIAFGEAGTPIEAGAMHALARPEALLLLGSAFLFAVNSVMQKPLAVRYGASTLAIYLTLACALPTLAFLPRVVVQLPAASAPGLAALVYLAVLPAAAAGFLWNYALARLSAVQVSSSLYMLSPVSFAIAWLWLGERPALLSVLGAALAIAGVALVQAPSVRARN